jgi:hypothetical protein
MWQHEQLTTGQYGCASILGRRIDRGRIAAMKMRKKSELPSKPCAHCGLAFAWRKKWERDWDQVKYCSERCRRAARPPAASRENAA